MAAVRQSELPVFWCYSRYIFLPYTVDVWVATMKHWRALPGVSGTVWWMRRERRRRGSVRTIRYVVLLRRRGDRQQRVQRQKSSSEGRRFNLFTSSRRSSHPRPYRVTRRDAQQPSLGSKLRQKGRGNDAKRRSRDQADACHPSSLGLQLRPNCVTDVAVPRDTVPSDLSGGVKG